MGFLRQEYCTGGDQGIFPTQGSNPHLLLGRRILYHWVTGDVGLIPGSGRSPEEGNGNPLQYSSLGNPMDRGAWRARVQGVAKSWAWLSDWHTQHMLGHRLPLGRLDAPPSMGEGFLDVFRWTWNHSPPCVAEEAFLQPLWISLFSMRVGSTPRCLGPFMETWWKPKRLDRQQGFTVQYLEL